MHIAPVRADRLSDKVVRQIIRMIQDGTLKSGDKLPTEPQFAEQFEVSRGVIREAMTQLQSQGYIRRKPKDGTYIKENSLIKLTSPVVEVIRRAVYKDLLDFREPLETKMVEIVIDRASDEEIDEIIENLNTSYGEEQQFSLDHYFHYKLAQASCNTFYMNFIDTYYDLIEEIAERSKRDQQRWQEVKTEHLEIADAIARRDKKAAMKAMALHLSNVRKFEEQYEE